MPAYRFSWDPFDDGTVRALAEVVGYEGPDDGAPREYLARRVKRPTPELIREAGDALCRTWLLDYSGTKHIVERLRDANIGPGSRPRTQRGYVGFLRDARNSGSLRREICDAMLRFGDMDRQDGEPDDPDFTPRLAILDVAAQPDDPRRPHDYQREAWDRLSRHLAESESTGRFQGLLVMPTGSGKTFTAVRWLMEHVVAQGRRVLWLAHRHELLTHAASEFHRLARLAAPRDRLRVRIVSGQHCATTQIDPEDDIVVASVYSLARREDIRERLLTDPRLFVVIDEAHHAPAKSYRDVIHFLEGRKQMRVLGLTATPTRTQETERPLLRKLFGGNVFFQVELQRLIERGILSRPRIVHVRTEADVEEGVTDADLAHLSRFGELSEEWLARIGQLAERNRAIVAHYLENRDRYGKTLVFAVNVSHAALLAEDLRQHGVRADYVASYRPDGTDGEPTELIQRFREGHLDVLVNVQMVTEGVDVPDMQSVFLTRPTASEILLRQMIGRALRGPAAGGTREAYLVSFEDHWARFRDWASPMDLVPDIEDAAEEPDSPHRLGKAMDALPWELIRATAARIRTLSADLKADAFEAIPHGWYLLEEVADDEGSTETLPVYAHQRPCWEALLDHLESLSPEALAELRFEGQVDELFDDCDDPRPAAHDIARMVAHFARGGPRPEYNDLEERDRCDPYVLAKDIWDRDLGERDRADLMEARYTTLARTIYPNLREFRAAVEDALHELRYPDEATHRPRAVPIFHPAPEDQLTPGPAHDLDSVFQEVLEVGGELLGVAEPLPAGFTCEWTRRIVKGWYGIANWDPGAPIAHGRIRINRLLDSPDIDANTMRFLLWHEYLHLYLQQGHTPTFRELERKWLGHIEAYRVLHNLNERFGIQYW